MKGEEELSDNRKTDKWTEKDRIRIGDEVIK